MKEKYLSEPATLQHLGISKTNFRKCISAGCPGRVQGKGFPLYDICRWVVARPMKRQDKTLLRANATKILDALKPSSTNPTPAPTDQTAKPKTRPGKLGLEAALARVEEMEKRLHDRLTDTIEGGGYDTSARLKEWQDGVEALRKIQGDTLKVLAEQKELVRVAAVKAWLDKKLETAKAFLLNLPGKIAPNLDGLPWHEIQKRLEGEIRNALVKLAANDLT